jgi:hypothetical protein
MYNKRITQLKNEIRYFYITGNEYQDGKKSSANIAHIGYYHAVVSEIKHDEEKY